MVLTRSQTRLATLGQTPSVVASPRANTPRRHGIPRQRNGDVGEPERNGGANAVHAAVGRRVNRPVTRPVDFIKKCGQTRCLFCKTLNVETQFRGTNSAKMYKVTETNDTYDCHTGNVIYLITCKGCDIQYVGETYQELHHRFNEHRSRIRNFNKCSQTSLLVDHLNGPCKDNGFEVNIIEKIPGNGRDADGKIDNNTTHKRRLREAYWMKELRTVYPFGLNNRCEKNMDQRDKDDNVYSMFNKKKKKKNRRRRHRSEVVKYPAQLVYDQIINSNSTKEAICYIQSTVPQMKKTELQKLDDLLEQTDIDDRIKNIFNEIVMDKIKKKVIHQPKRKFGNPLKILYHNKAMDYINLPKILHNKQVEEKMPTGEDETPNVVYKYTPSIRGKIFNYRQTMENLDIQEWNTNEHLCDCEESIFKDQHHGHVITGDLKIIQNDKLRKLISKGPNFREKNSINFSVQRKEIEKGLNKYIESISSRKKILSKYWDEWKDKVMKCVDENINRIRKTKLKSWVRTRKVLQDNDAVTELERLHDKYVMVPIDKAANNVGFVCKKYYIEKILEELEGSTYERPQTTKMDVINRQVESSKEVKCVVPNEYKCLPYIHATIKMHKNPVKFRFIIASRKCATKIAAKKLTKILKLVLNTHFRYCEKIKWYTGVNRMWVSKGTADVLEQIEKINKRKKARNLSTFDFSTLYTKIDLEDLKDKLKWCIDKAFKGGTNQWIKVSKEAHFNNGKNGKDDELFSKEQVYKMLELVVDQAYFAVGDNVYRQCVGIPMGTDPGPFLANFYLYSYEFKYMEKLTKENYGVARRNFAHVKRFIDDLLGPNNDKHIENNWKEIYPPQMVLNKENENDSSASFLDLLIDKEGNEFKTKLFDKRDAYGFEIVCYPDLNGNIPPGPAYGVFKGQMLRIARNCSSFAPFQERVKNMIRILKGKNYDPQRLKTAALGCIRKYRDLFMKFSLPYAEIVNRIF